MRPNIVYLSGVHGSGKTTIYKELTSQWGFQSADRLNVSPPSGVLDKPYDRAIFRLCKYYLENLVHSTFELANNQWAVADRCVFDTLVYVNAYSHLGWITKGAREDILDVFYALFSSDKLPRTIVHLSPPYTWVALRLADRWRTATRGWREDDLVYLRAVMDGYRIFYSAPSQEAFLGNRPNVLTLATTNLRDNVAAISAFAALSQPTGLRKPSHDSLVAEADG